jgi:16S rRNA (guanine527-N7)-methyltransferase
LALVSEGALVPAWFGEVLERELGDWGRLSPEQIEQLSAHYLVLERWNERISLTSVKPGVEMVVRHFCESLFFGINLSAGEKARILDIGSGAGFPGLPMAVLRPDWAVSLVESVQRKSVFLREASRHLHNVTVLGQRAEQVKAGFDWVVSRAVHPEEVLRNLPRLASKVGLLLGETNLSLLKSFPAIAWGEPIRLPWGDRRFCVFGEMFHVKRST